MSDVDEIKSRLDIVDVVGSYVTLKKSGINYKGLCPFHTEKSPSFMVNPERQIYKCFGCGEGGDIFEFVQKQENLTFPEALQVLADRASYTLQDKRSKINQNQEPDQKSKLYQINNLAAQTFYAVLTKHPAGQGARDYLKNRGITDKTITTFRIGYAPEKPVLGPVLTKRNFASRDFSAAGHPERFHNRIMFPIEDVLGNVIGFTGRALTDEVQPKYFNTPETPIFHKSRVLYGLHQAKQAIKTKDYAVFLEGQMDVVLAHQVGITNAIATSGTAITADHLKIISRYTQNLIFSFDMDAAGQKTTTQALQMASALDLVTKVAILPPPYKDAGEAIKADPSIYRTALKEARFSLDWVLDRAFRGQYLVSGMNEKEEKTLGINPEILNTKYQIPTTLSVVQKKQVAREVLPFLAKIVDPIEQAHWIGTLAKRLGVPEESIRSALNRVRDRVDRGGSQADWKRSETESSNKAHTEDRSGEKPASPKLIPNHLLLGLLRLHPDYQKIYSALYKTLDTEYSGDRNQLELQVEEYAKTLPPDSVGVEIETLVNRHHQTDKEQLKTSFASQIAEAETTGNRKLVKELLKKLQEEIGN